MSTENDVVTKPVNATTLVEPQFLTLTKKPANQVGFKIVRNEEQTMSGEQADSNRVKRVRVKRGMTPMMSVMFPAGTTEEEAKALMEQYGITDYTLTTSGGNYVAIRSDLQEVPADAVAIGIGDGIKAFIQRSALSVAPENDPAPYVSVTAIRFDKAQFPTESDVSSWLETNDIDFLEGGIKNGDESITVCRAEMADGAEAKEIVIGEGVTFQIARSVAQDVPAPFIEVVSETAYGNWGWGQLDFAAAMADQQYSDVARNALYTMEDVLRNIMFYSPLPVAVRKDLVNRASTQFAAYIGGLLDALPSKVVMINRSILESKEKQMSKNTDAPGAEQAQRSEGAAPATSPEPKQEYVTRAELAETVTAAVTAALEAAGVKRAEPAPESPASAATDASTEALTAITRSMEAMSKSMETMSATIGERLTKLEGTTILRSDNGDQKAAPVERKDVFKGVFNLGTARGE